MPALPEFKAALVKLPTEIGQVVKAERKRLKLTQATAAGLCNVGTRFLSDLENGKPTLQVGLLLKVLKNFGLEVIIRKRTFPSGQL